MMSLRSRSVLAAVLCVAAISVFDVGVAAAARGYQARPCGFDLNHNGIVGEPADCHICDGVTKDPDNDGVNEDLIYVDCGGGSDTSMCGSPSSPCKTINYAFNTRADGPGDGAEDIVCFKGICKTDDDINPTSGVSGTYTVPSTGSEVRDWKYPKNPAMLVGWDSDKDGQYPPYDTDDVAILDGGPNQLNVAIANEKAASYVELAHFTARDYGRTTTATDNIGFARLSATTGDFTEYYYFHDLSLQNINKDKMKNSFTAIFNVFRGSINKFTYLAQENLECRECGGYFERGGVGNGPDVSGPFRMQNVTFTAHPCDGSGTGVCPTDPSSKATSTVIKVWGYLTGVEILDNVFDANVSAWIPYGTGSTYAVSPCQCSQNWDIVNNEFIDWKQSVIVQPYASGYCDTRPTQNIRIDRNVIRNQKSPSPWGGIMPITLEAGGTNANQTAKDVSITNNAISSVAGYKYCIDSADGYNASCSSHGGQITIADNTCDGDVTAYGAITIGAVGGTDVACPADNYVLKNNIVSGISSSSKCNVATSLAPATWAANNNAYDAEGCYRWNDSTTGSISTWRQASAGDSKSKTCAPSYMDRAAGNFHLKSTDTCALDAGTDLSTITRVDMDAGTRPGGTAWDIGADEYGVTGGGDTPPPPPPPTNTPPPAPVLIDVVPLPN